MINKITKYLFILPSILAIVACGGGAKNDTLSQKKAELDKLKKEQATVNDKIAALEAEILKLDTNAAANANAKLVVISTVSEDNFNHYIDLQGTVEAENISYVSPKLGPGLVKAVYVKQGQQVSKGQLLLKLDDAVQRQQVVQAQSQLAGVNAQLNMARDVASRREKLWKQGIGTEVELINARTQVKTLEAQLATVNETIKLARETANGTNVYAEMSGVADAVNIRPGETFTGMAGATPQIRIVNTNTLKVTAQVPENYTGKVKQGDSVIITLPDLNKTIKAKIALTGRIIDPTTRSFEIEAKLPANLAKPNQLARLQIKDYAAKTLTIPLNTLQTDEKGKYVMVAVQEKDKTVARKREVTTGQLYGETLELLSGLKQGDQLIIEGFQGLYDGQQITTK